jgi:ATP-dependent protease HslVU (ClpYQ) peptidase subunit
LGVAAGADVIVGDAARVRDIAGDAVRAALAGAAALGW